MLAGNNLSQIKCYFIITFGTIRINGKFLKIVTQKCTKWLTDSFGHECFMLPRQNVPLSGEHVEGKHVCKIIWTDCGTKLFQHLRRENLRGLPCVIHISNYCS
jgi:hypothetical protein